MTLRVVVLNWRNYLGRGLEYVSKMHSMVSRHLTIPFEFHEITERDLPSGREGWFNKLSLLELFDDEALYIDLDCVVCGNIDHLVELARTDPSRLWARDDFSYSRATPREGLDADFLRTLGGPGTINSSVMWWRGRRNIEPLDGAHGDQNAITAALWPDGIGLLPDRSIKSYKYHRGETAPIIVLHGQPKNHEVIDDYIVRNWR
jgi:hypothetical protein